MFTDERRGEILRKLEVAGRVTAKDLAEEFQMSIDSIRRDLSIMEEQGLLKRTHGGAIPVTSARTLPRPPAERFGDGTDFQHAIAQKAATYIRNDKTIFIGGASIHYVLLKYLPTDIPFTVLTNSVEIAYALRDRENVTTYLIGGQVKSSGNITDSLANEFARQFTVDLCFATGGALSAKGLSTATPEVAIFYKTIYNNAKRLIALVEHTKIGQEMFAGMYSLEKLDVVITDEETDEEKVKAIQAAGVEVLVAKN
ncbi:DeoR/GlpR family DNA-binding transcription regulator [Bacillus sp. THAF10]|uniref:DeoR/GlpR family DNA-binding transcription regulator n=1 Tax=Bacillus sp. THAF10 TaxID=2587848 RepID=UPI001267D4AF|nr:DeoR/GlpR family DNA-binding transcription regulator [Bacillus sp. THAF10]